MTDEETKPEEEGLPDKNYKVPHMTDEDLRTFVKEFLAGHIFTSQQIPEGQEHLLHMVFIPLAFGAANRIPEEELQNIGLIYANINEAGPRSINGLPQFFSCSFMHKDDLDRAQAAIDRESQHQKEFEV